MPYLRREFETMKKIAWNKGLRLATVNEVSFVKKQREEKLVYGELITEINPDKKKESFFDSCFWGFVAMLCKMFFLLSIVTFGILPLWVIKVSLDFVALGNPVLPIITICLIIAVLFIGITSDPL